MIHDDEWEQNRARRFRELHNPDRVHPSVVKYRNMPEYYSGADLSECQAAWETKDFMPQRSDERYFETLGQEVNRLSEEVGRLRDLVLQRWGKGQTKEHKGFDL